MIAVVGEALVDAHVDGATMRTYVGGGPYNTAVALGRLGVPTAFGGSISNDPDGGRLLGGLERAGVSFTGARVGAHTPLALVDPAVDSGDRYRFYLRGTAFECVPAPAAVPREAAALVVGSLALALDPPGAAVESIAVEGRAGRLVVVDPNVRADLVDVESYRARVERLARAGALIKLSRDDAQALFPAAGGAARLLARGAAGVVVTYGSGGAAAFTQAGTFDTRAPAVDVVDTVGAGDAFTAGLLAWLRRAGALASSALRALEPASWVDALAYAAAAGAAQCTRASAWGPSAADVEQVLASQFVTGG